jgi:hypothetical protein
VEDPERVIAEALRAQAARTPLPSAEATQVNAAPGMGLAGSGYGLLSGSDLALSLPTAPIESPTEAVGTRRMPAERRVSVGAILLLAVVLGLAAGAVVGLVTLL